MKAEFVLGLATAGLLCLEQSAAAKSAAKPAPPQTYTAIAQLTEPDGLKHTFRIYRDGARERIDSSFPDHPGVGVSTMLFDFEAHKVYWVGYSGAGSCSAGRYPSRRAPINQDSITARADKLPKTKHKVIGAETVNAIPCRLEEFAPAKSSDKPLRAWIADPGDFVVKLEGKAEDGKPKVVYEVMAWTTDKTPAEQFLPPSNCVMTDSEMSDDGMMSAHAESKKSVVKAKASLDFGHK